MNGIYEHNWINLIQRAVLPIVNVLKDLVCDIGDKALRAFKTVDFFNLFRYLSCSKTFGIHADNLLIDFGYIFLVFFHNLWLKGAVSVLWNGNLKFTI